MFKRNGLKRIALAAACTGLAIMTACGGAKVPNKYDYNDFSKYIKLGEYKGLAYDKVAVTVSNAEVQEHILNVVRSSSSTEEIKEGTVAADSVVKIDYTGKIDGKKFKGGSAENYQLSMAESNFIAGFAEQIVGHKVGETFDIKVTFPKNYSNNQDLAGKEAVFTIKVKALVKTVTPEYDEEFVKKNTEYKTKAEYEKSVRKQLGKDKKSQAASAEKQQVFQQILASSTVKKYPEKEYKAAYDKIVKTYKDLAKASDTEYETYLKNNLGMSKKDFEAQAKTAAENTVKQQLVLYALAKEFKISISDSEYGEYLDKLLKEAGYTADQYEKAAGMSIEKYAEDNNLFETMLYEKVMEQVMKKSKANS